MKKILLLVFIAVFVIRPLGAVAKATAVSDSDLGAVFAQSGLYTVTFQNLYVESQVLVTTSSDFSHFWGPDRPDYNSIDTPKSGFDGYPELGWFGFADVYVYGGLLLRSGALTMEFIPAASSDVLSKYQLQIGINNLAFDGSAVGVYTTVKLGTDPTLAGTQVLGRAYMTLPSFTLSADLTVSAHASNTTASRFFAQ